MKLDGLQERLRTVLRKLGIDVETYFELAKMTAEGRYDFSPADGQ